MDAQQGHDKGKVEGLVGYARLDYFVPAPRCVSYEDLNELLQTGRRPGAEVRLGTAWMREDREALTIKASATGRAG